MILKIQNNSAVEFIEVDDAVDCIEKYLYNIGYKNCQFEIVNNFWNKYLIKDIEFIKTHFETMFVLEDDYYIQYELGITIPKIIDYCITTEWLNIHIGKLVTEYWQPLKYNQKEHNIITFLDKLIEPLIDKKYIKYHWKQYLFNSDDRYIIKSYPKKVVERNKFNPRDLFYIELYPIHLRLKNHVLKNNISIDFCKDSEIVPYFQNYLDANGYFNYSDQFTTLKIFWKTLVTDIYIIRNEYCKRKLN